MRGITSWVLLAGVTACGGREVGVGEPAGSSPDPASAQSEASARPGASDTGREGSASNEPSQSTANPVLQPIVAGVDPSRPRIPRTEPTEGPPAAYDAGVGASAGECPVQYAASAVSLSPWEPYVDATDGDAIDAQLLFETVQRVMPGAWRGFASSPWNTPYLVELTFRSDGTYSGRCVEQSEPCCVAFYYGSDDDTPIKRYRVQDATLQGNVLGEIDIAFDYDSEYGLPGWQGELSHIEPDATGNGLRFWFTTSTGYGPIQYDLRRVDLD